MDCSFYNETIFYDKAFLFTMKLFFEKSFIVSCYKDINTYFAPQDETCHLEQRSKKASLHKGFFKKISTMVSYQNHRAYMVEVTRLELVINAFI